MLSAHWRHVKTTTQASTVLRVGRSFGQLRLSSTAFERRAQAFVQEKARQVEQQLKQSNGIQQPSIEILLPDGSKKIGSAGTTTPLSIAQGISGKLAKSTLIAQLNGNTYWDMSRPLQESCQLELIPFQENNDRLTNLFWHSSAHVLGMSLEAKYGSRLLLCDGPAIKQGGFFYEFLLAKQDQDPSVSIGELLQQNYPAHQFSKDEIADIQRIMQQFIAQRLPFERLAVSQQFAYDLFPENKFKQHFIGNIPKDSEITLYKCGPFVDLCRGPHVQHTGQLQAMEILRTSNAYFMPELDRDPKSPQALTRMYGIAFPSPKELKQWHHQKAEAEKRDHRIIGKNQGLFAVHQASPGSAFMLPHGTRIVERLMRFMRQQYRKYGFEEVMTPLMYKKELWETSGHWQNYKDDMFQVQRGCDHHHHGHDHAHGQEGENKEKGAAPLAEGHDEVFGLKPMNCPGHCLIFDMSTRSYKDLPIRYADFSALHRNESTGSLTGLTRVRRFHQDDAHIFCTRDQIFQEIRSTLSFVDTVYRTFKFPSYELALSTRPLSNFIGSIQEWDTAEDSLREALNQSGLQWSINEGDGAFYGPKIDILVRDALGRRHQTATIQLDFQLPQRFGLQFYDQQGEKQSPVIVHRAVLGSVERMMAILIEHTGGRWPFWISPRQAMVVPVFGGKAGLEEDSSNNGRGSLTEYANHVRETLSKAGRDPIDTRDPNETDPVVRMDDKHYFVDIDQSSGTLNKMVRDAQVAQYNFILVIGEKEKERGTVNVRTREGERLGEMTIPEVLKLFQEREDKFLPIALPDEPQTALKHNTTSAPSLKDRITNRHRNNDDPPSAYDQANIFSLITFHYIQSVISTGYRRAVTDVDTANMMPHSVRTVSSYERLSRLWNRHVEKKRTKASEGGRGGDGGGVSLFWVVVKMGGWMWIPILFFMFMESILEYAQPLLLDRLLVFISTYSVSDQGTRMTEPEPVWVGVVLSLGLTAASIGASVGSAQFIQLATNLGISLQSALVSMVYQKSLRLSSGARRGGGGSGAGGSGRGTPDMVGDEDEDGTKTDAESKKTASSTTSGTSVGEIQNLMSVDVVAVQFGIIYLPLMISTPFEIIVGLYLLYAQLGLSSLAGLGVVLLMTPVQGWLARMLSVAKGKKMEVMDERIRVLTEMLSSMQVIKLYHWGMFFYRRIEGLRAREVKALKRVGAVMAGMSIMATSIPTLMGLLSFTVYALAGGENHGRGYLSPQVVFVSLSLFGRLAVPIGRASRVISMVISLRVAAGRIQRFLLLEEMDWEVVTHPESDDSAGREQDESGAISIRDGVFSWTSGNNTNNTGSGPLNDTKNATSATLQDINLTIPRGSLTAVVGRVGQGKSSLLSALIGEMYKHQGSVQVLGSVAFVSQQAWIQNETIMGNILFGKPLDQERYDDVVRACCLQRDLEMLAAGDQTEIGERGINLSGGQKQRIALARAAYQDADIYLLDDPLSAVDAHVDQHLWQNLIGPSGLLKDKTRLLVTHGVHHLGSVDQIVIIKGGQILASGTYEQLLSAGSLTSQELALSVRNVGAGKGTAATVVVAGSANEVKESDDVAEVKDKDGQEGDGQLIQKEEYTHGGAGWKEFLSYAKAASYFLSLSSMALFIFSQAVQLGISIWLQKWTERPFDNQLVHLGQFLGVYAVMVVAYASSDVLVHYIVFVTSGLRAANLLHNNLLARIIRLPMHFFDSTPVGRVVNRFSTDQDTVDVLLPQALSDFYYYTFTVLGTLVIISMTLPIFIATLPFLFGFYVLIQRYYVRTSRAMTHVHAIARSPLFQHFNETLAGVSTIRAMRQEGRFVEENAKRTDCAANAYFVTTVASRWLHFRLECLGATVVLVTSLLVVLETVRQKDQAVLLGASLDGKAGLALNYALTATYGITFLVTSVTDLQNRLVSVERVREYCEVPSEAPLRNEVVDNDLEEREWPREGGVVFMSYSTRYRQGMDLVLKKVSFEVLPGEKVGIVGRTGAGKSSLTLALFRIVEAANSHLARDSYNNRIDKDKAASKAIDDMLQSVEVEEDGGSIWIDGVDISTMGLEHLRQHLAIIPQDPTLFEGTLRENLDPFHRSTDAELWTALERAHLKDFITTSLSGGLSYEVTSSGSNFSIGQRSLICLARALLQKTKILILDEATAAVDVETDELIQKTIRTEFKDRTILTIAHRIKTVMDSDKILVLDQGRVVEYESPEVLLGSKEGSLFFRLAEQTGEVKL